MSHKSVYAQRNIAKMLGVDTDHLAVREFLGAWKSAFKGNGISFAESRPYQSGDPQNRIDWKTTAKKAEVYVKEFEEERQLRFVCFADSGASMQEKAGFVQDTATLFWYAAQNLGDQFGGGTFHQNPGKYLQPTQSLHALQQWKNQYQRTLKEGKEKQSSVRNLVKYCSKIRLKDTVCIIICDDMLEKEVPKLSWLAKNNDCIFVHCFDPFETSLDTGKGEKQAVLGNPTEGGGVSGFFRRVMLTENMKKQYKQRFEEARLRTKKIIRKAGADYVQMHTNEDPLRSWMCFFTKRKQYRGGVR